MCADGRDIHGESRAAARTAAAARTLTALSRTTLARTTLARTTLARATLARTLKMLVRDERIKVEQVGVGRQPTLFRKLS